MRSLGIIKSTADYRACEFQAKAKPVPLKDLQAGDLVFNKKSDASHVGVFDGELVVESKGRSDGVVRRKVTAGSWVIGGRLDWFDNDIPILLRNLRYIKDDLMKGEDVKQCQEQLNKKGFDAGVEDGIYGIRTLDSVISFQTANDLDPDGIVGQKTWSKLWE